MFLNSGSSRSRSLKMGPSDKSYTTSYWSAKHCTIVEFDVEEWCDFDGSLRSLEMASLDRSHTSSCSSSVFHCNYDPILYRFREKARYWSKSRFFITLLYWENGCEYFRAVFSQPSQVPGLSGGVNRFAKSHLTAQVITITDYRLVKNRFKTRVRVRVRVRVMELWNTVTDRWCWEYSPIGDHTRTGGKAIPIA